MLEEDNREEVRVLRHSTEQESPQLHRVTERHRLKSQKAETASTTKSVYPIEARCEPVASVDDPVSLPEGKKEKKKFMFSLSLESVTRTLAVARYRVVDIYISGGFVQFIHISSMDYLLGALIHISELLNVRVPDPVPEKVEVFQIRGIDSLKRTIVPCSRVDLQDTWLDSDDRSSLSERVRKSLKLVVDPETNNRLDEAAVIWLNDCTRQLRRFRRVCLQTSFGIALQERGVMVTLEHTTGVISIFTLEAPAVLPTYAYLPMFDIKDLESMLVRDSPVSLTLRVPHFEAEVCKALELHIQEFRNAGDTLPATYHSIMASICLAIETRRLRWSDVEANIDKFLTIRNELLVVHEQALLHWESAKADKRILERKVVGDRETRNAERAVRDTRAAEELARGAYSIHRAKRASILSDKEYCRQVFTGYLLEVDRNLSDCYLFCNAMSARIKRLGYIATK